MVVVGLVVVMNLGNKVHNRVGSGSGRIWVTILQFCIYKYTLLSFPGFKCQALLGSCLGSGRVLILSSLG